MTIKICEDCGEEKQHQAKGLCKRCYHKEYSKNNRIKLMETTNRWRKKNPEKVRFINRVSDRKHKDARNKRKREYYQENKESILLKNKLYMENNRPEYNKMSRNWKRKRLQFDLGFRILNNLRVRIKEAIHNSKKSARTRVLVGCSITYLRNYLESQFDDEMSWANYGKFGWHIDHIKPCVSFDLRKEEEQRECFNYTNLQPLWAKDNLRKGSKIEAVL